SIVCIMMKYPVVFIASAFAVAQAAVSPPSQFTGTQSGIGSWFQTNAESSSTHGNSWCGYPYSDDQPLFAPVRHRSAPRKPPFTYMLCLNGYYFLADELVSPSLSWVEQHTQHPLRPGTNKDENTVAEKPESPTVLMANPCSCTLEIHSLNLEPAAPSTLSSALS
ncbi:MAG: hypothetical protein L6R38_007837, partial [Xanthoria sp. 2 TBL-2021]